MLKRLAFAVVIFAGVFVLSTMAYGVVLGALAGFGIVPGGGTYLEYSPLVALIAGVYAAGRWST